jgi:hypothetical protein
VGPKYSIRSSEPISWDPQATLPRARRSDPHLRSRGDVFGTVDAARGSSVRSVDLSADGERVALYFSDGKVRL